MHSQIDTKYPCDQDGNIRLSRETIIFNMWVIAKVLRSDTKALDALHEIYFQGHRNLAESADEAKELMEDAQIELLARYDRYYKVWDDSEGSNQFVFAGTAIDFFLGKDSKAKMDFSVLHSVLTHTLSAMKAIQHFRDGVEIVDDGVHAQGGSKVALDFTVYRQETHRSNQPGVISETRDVPTELKVSDLIKAKIAAVPDLARIFIYDGPYSFRKPSYGKSFDERGDFFYVHYTRSSEVAHLGVGTVIVFQRDSGAVVYDGSDNME
jgi:hypothetical protein